MDYIAELRKKKQQEYVAQGAQKSQQIARQQQIVQAAKAKTATTPTIKTPSTKTTDKPSTTVKLPSLTPSIKTPSSTGASSSDSKKAASPMFRRTAESTAPKTTLKSTVAQNLSKGALQQSTQKVSQLKADQQVRTEQRYQRYDVDAAQKQINALKAQLKSEKSKLAPDRTVRSGHGKSYTVKSDRTHSLGGNTAKRKELESQIKSLEGEASRAKQVQKAYSFASVWDDPNFEETAQKGAAKKGNVVVNSRAHKNPQGHRGRAGRDSHFTDAAYSNMTDAEVKTYNYLYETDEKQAKEYLSFIRETLNQRQGVKEGKLVRGNKSTLGRTVGTAVYGVGAGLDQFGSGAMQFLSSERLPATATQYGSAYIRQDLADTGPKLPDWAGGASLGQAAYDTVTTTANMAPSILLTALAGPAGASAAAAETLGSATIGLSAAGNAYNQALAEGRTKAEARLYSTMIGASEAYLQKTFGGITAFGGSLANLPGLKVAINNLDSSLKRLSANLAVKMLSEGSEEYAQDVLDPVFRNWFYGEKNEVKLWTPEATYSFLLGAVTSLGLEGVGTVRSELELNRQGAQIKGAHFEKDLIKSALSLDKETEAYQTAKDMRSGKAKDNTHNVGELFNQYVRAGGDLSIFDAPVSASEVNAETTAQTNTTLDAVTSALMEIDMGGSKMSLKTAREKADIIRRYMDGELLTPKEINKLNLTDQNTRGVFEEFTTVQLPEDFNRLPQGERVQKVMELQRRPLEDTGAEIAETPTAQPLSSAQETQAVPEGNFTPETKLAAESAAEAQSRFDSAREEIIHYEDFANQLRELYPDVADEDIRPYYEQYAAELGGQQNGSQSEDTITVGGVDYPMNFSEFEQFMQQMSDQTGMPLPTEGSLREMFDAQLAQQRGNYNEEVLSHGEEAAVPGGEGSRRGGEPQRASGLATEGPSESVQRGTEETEQRRAPARVRAKMLRDHVRSSGVKEQSAREVGIAGGTDRASLRIVPEDLYTDEMRSVLDECAAQGVKVSYFTGYLNIADGEGGSFSARAAINREGTQMWVKADHADYSVDQLARHEMFHRDVAENPAILEDALANIAAEHSESELQKMVSRYVQQYGWTERSANDVLEEICADAAAGIDIFNLPDAVSRGAADFAEPVQRAVAENGGGVDSEAKAPYNKYRKQPLGKEARTALKRMQQGETLSYDELLAIPEIDEAMRRPQEKSTYDLPNREKIRAEAKRKTLERGSYSGVDENGKAKYDGPVKQERRMDIVMGLPGSGKSSVYSDGLSAEHSGRISDVDDVRPFIPEYNGTNAAVVHKEAKVVSEAALNEALENGDNIVLSIIGDDADKLRARIRTFEAEGYDVYLHLNELPNEKALNRAVSRYLTDGRWVPLNMIYEFEDKPTRVYLELTGQEGALNGEERRRNGIVAEGRGRSGENLHGEHAEVRGGTPEEHLSAGADAGTGEAVQLESAPRDGGKAVRLAGFDRYSNDVKRGEPPRLDRATSKSHDTYEKAKRAKEQVNKGTKFSTETTDAEYKDALDSVVSLMKEHDLYVPQDVLAAMDSAKPGDELSYKLKNAINGTDSFDIFDQLWDDEKMEIEDLLDRMQEIETSSAEQAEAQENSDYQSAVKDLITFMKNHGMKVPASVENAVDTIKPSAAASLALEESYLNDPVYWELSDAEDDAFQQLVDAVSLQEKAPSADSKDTGYTLDESLLQYEDDPGEEISDEELEHLFGSTLADAEGYKPRAELMEGLQEKRFGFTKTDTPQFKKWFNDDSGRLTTEDGKPRVLLSGGARMGRTAINFDFNTKSSPGFWATESSEVADTYARGMTSKNSVTLMDAVYHYQPTREVQLRNADSWVDAVDYIGEYWEHDGYGFRLVPLDQEGNIISDADLADRWALQTNLTSQEEFNASGDFAESDYRTVETYPANDEGLRRFNYDIGDVIDKMGAGVRGYAKIYGSAKHTLVVDAEGEHFAYIPTGGLPKDIREASIPRKESHVDADEYVHVNDLVRYAFNNGYDAVVIDNVDDTGGLQTQYAFRDSSQIKSVYNGGEWNPNEKNFKFSQEKPSMTIEDFVKRYNEQFGEGAANELYQSVKQMERAKARAERKLEQQKESAQAERSLNDQRLRDNATAWMIYHKKNLRTIQQEYRAKLDDARRAKTAAVRDAIRETQTVERAVADVRVEAEREKGQQRLADQREKAAQKLENTRLAERMNAKKQAAERLRVKENTYADEKARARDDTKLRRNAAKAALRDKRRVAEKRAAIETEQGPIDTIRKNPKERTALERAQEAASSLKTLGRSAYRAFVNQAEGIDRFAKRQKGGMLASTLVNIVGGASTTTETIYKSGLVNRAGDRVGDSMKDVFLCWDERNKHVDENKQALLQDYMLHKHNIDRMSFVSNAREALETFESEHPWVKDMDPNEFAKLAKSDPKKFREMQNMGRKEFAKLVAMTDAEVKKTGKDKPREIAQEYAKLLNDYSEARDKPVFPDKNGNPITAVTSAEVVEKYEAENPWLKEKAEGIYAWWDKFMREWVVGDTLSAQDYEVMHEMYPHYVPTYRADKKALGAGSFVGMGGASVGSVVKKAKGGLSEIVNIEDSFANLADKAIRVARTNELYRNMIDTAMLDDAGKFSDMAVFDWEDMDSRHDAYMKPDGEVVLIHKNGFELTDAVSGAEKAGLQKTKDGYVLSARYDGDIRRAYISEDLFKSIQNTTSSSANDLERGILKLGNALTGPMKTAITGINPSFALRNISRDFPTAVINSISGMAFPKYYAQAAHEMLHKSDHWQQYKALGGTNATYYNDQQGFAKEMSKGDGIGSKVVGALGWVNERSEAQTRFAEYLATIDRLGDTYENRLLGIKNSAEVTVDFGRKGRYGKVINAWVPYWNPAVQGIDKVLRSVVDSPEGSARWKQALKTVGRASMTSVLAEAVIYALLKGLDRYDDWEELDDRTKDTYYCIPMADEHRFFRIPKNREWGAILGTPLMRILERANGREDPFENYAETSLESNFLPGAILRFGGERVESDVIGVSQALDLAYNKDFAGRSIVPYAYEQGSVTEQYDADTSMFARKLGEMLKFSPMQIDYIVKDYFGDFGKLFVSATSEATWNGDTTAQDYAESVWKMIEKQWTSDNRTSNQDMSDYYDTLDNLEKLVQDRKNRLGSEAAQDTVEYKTQKAMEKLYGKQITELNRSVRDMPEGEEKYRIKGQAAALAEEALTFYRQCMSGQIKNPTLTADYSDLPTSLSNELIRLDGLGKDYSFKPGNYTPTKYNDPRKKNYEYILDDEQKDKYKETYREVYAELMEEAMNKEKYRGGTDIEKAEILEATRDDVTEETRDRFLEWLRDNYRSTKKDKK